MLIDITLIFLFVAATATVWYFVSLKIPELVAIPDEVINERLAEDSARFRLITVNIKGFYRQRGYLLLLLQFLVKILHKLHIVFLKIDNRVVSLLKRIREKNSGMVGNMGGYLKKRREREEEE